MLNLSQRTADKIVEAVKDVCGRNINFINADGFIFASTDKARIGEFHEIGKKVIDTQEIIEVFNEHTFHGTKPGVNIPVAYNNKVIAAIGISGMPDEVRQFAILAQKITALILREQELDSIEFNSQNQMRSIIYALLENKFIHQEYLVDFLAKRNLSINQDFRTMVIKINSRYNPSNLLLMESEVQLFLKSISSAMYTFNYPNEYWVIISDKDYMDNTHYFQMFARRFTRILSIGVGNKESINRQFFSYNNAGIAVHVASDENNIILYDYLTLELITGNVSEILSDKYIKKTVVGLGKDEISLLRIYFEHDMSLKETAEELFIHKNTVQYQLKRIEETTGYDPRKFNDAVILYLGIKLIRD
ncbi:MAG: sugar diacid recognition domain-containing protein [Eubacteriales bacterium]|nr:sugar diacid recognition domain-containing protein [Eubacteriales bacterium]